MSRFGLLGKHNRMREKRVSYSQQQSSRSSLAFNSHTVRCSFIPSSPALTLRPSILHFPPIPPPHYRPFIQSCHSFPCISTHSHFDPIHSHDEQQSTGPTRCRFSSDFRSTLDEEPAMYQLSCAGAGSQGLSILQCVPRLWKRSGHSRRTLPIQDPWTPWIA